MKPNFPNKMHLASKLFTTIHVVIIIHKHFFSPLTPLYNCPVINLNKSKIGVYKEEIVENFGIFCRSSPSVPSQISDSYEEGGQQCERQADNT